MNTGTEPTRHQIIVITSIEERPLVEAAMARFCAYRPDECNFLLINGQTAIAVQEQIGNLIKQNSFGICIFVCTTTDGQHNAALEELQTLLTGNKFQLQHTARVIEISAITLALTFNRKEILKNNVPAKNPVLNLEAIPA